MLIVGFGGKVWKTGAFGAEKRLDGAIGRLTKNEELKMKDEAAKEGAKC